MQTRHPIGQAAGHNQVRECVRIMAPHVRVDSYTLRWFIIFPLSSAAGIDLLAYLVVRIWQYPPDEARSVFGHSRVGVTLSVTLGLKAHWAMRRYRAEHIRVCRMTPIERMGNLLGLKAVWPCLAFYVALIVGRGTVGIAFDLVPGLLDGPLLLLNLWWGLPIAAGEVARIRREAGFVQTDH